MDIRFYTHISREIDYRMGEYATTTNHTLFQVIPLNPVSPHNPNSLCKHFKHLCHFIFGLFSSFRINSDATSFQTTSFNTLFIHVKTKKNHASDNKSNPFTFDLSFLYILGKFLHLNLFLQCG